MKAADAKVSYLELLKFASPETIVVITALAVLAVGLGTGRVRSTTTVSTVQRTRSASNSATAMRICSAVAGLGLAIAAGVVLQLPQGTTLFGGMLVITPFTSLFKIICIALALFTVLLIASQKSTPHPGEYLALVLFATVGLMLLVGFAFKIAAAPFHLWAPDAYQGAPVPSAGFIASASKVASFVVLGKIVLVGFAPVRGSAAWHAMLAGWSPVLAVLAALSILVGNLVALAQSNVRRLLAYSAVAHGGYTLIGIVAGDREGFSAALFYASVYAVTLVGAFGVVAMVRHETGGDDFSNFRGLAFRSPFMAGCMAIFMLSLAGIPPLAGFFGKFYVFSAALRATPDHGLLWLVVVALLVSFVSLYYYLIVLKAIFVDEAAVPATHRVDSFSSDLLQRSTVVGLSAAVRSLGIMPGILATRILAAVP